MGIYILHCIEINKIGILFNLCILLANATFQMKNDKKLLLFSQMETVSTLEIFHFSVQQIYKWYSEGQ